MVAYGTKRRIAVTQQFDRYRSEPDIRGRRGAAGWDAEVERANLL